MVASGDTKPVGKDAASGDDVHVVDFSSVKTPGKGYTLKVGADVSHPFDIGADIYTKLKYDALALLLSQPQRHRDHDAVRAARRRWPRPAGHLSKPPNTGDKAVPCLPGSGCDVQAGRHRRLVRRRRSRQVRRQRRHLGLDDAEPVRAGAAGAGTGADFGDGKMNIPEKKNKTPDILDEARWQMEFMLKMQVPDGQPQGGDGAPQDPRQGVDRPGHARRTRTRSRASSGRCRRRPR